MNSRLLELLRHDLATADYTVNALQTLWGTSADLARYRGVLSPARRVLAEQPSSRLATIARLFVLGDAVSEELLTEGFPSLGVSGAIELGIISPVARSQVLGRHGGHDERGVHESDSFRAALSLNPVVLPGVNGAIEWWILSDLDDHLRRGPAAPDHVMGLGGATRSLLAQLPFGPETVAVTSNALDLGTGCGVVAMFLAHAGVPRVVATDISERALMLARANVELNRVDDYADPATHASALSQIEFRQGDLFGPVAGETFDLIVSNPPFVITPRSDGEMSERYEYRDAGMTGDELAAKVVREAPAHLAESGSLICLANWETPWGGDGLERVRGWIADAQEMSGNVLDAWVIERDRIDPAQYAETWARDGGARPGDPEFDVLIDAWLSDFSARHIVSVGLGSIRLARSANTEGTVRTEQAMGQITAEGFGVALLAAFNAGIHAASMSDNEALGSYWLRTAHVSEEREYEPGEEDPRAIRLVVATPIGRRIDVDPLLAAALGASDGDLTLQQLAGALATLLDVSEADAAAALVDGMRELTWLGMVVPSPR